MGALRYSPKWAHGVVLQLEEAYPRGTGLLYKHWSIDRKELTMLLASGSKRWRICRELARYLQKHTSEAMNASQQYSVCMIAGQTHPFDDENWLVLQLDRML